ncbi:MAG: pyruvate formate lyase family protein [Verrucomicrobiota bacterium]|nr:pyruvate formate lyase family protein [Verrucomicrobiota bacterium]
MKTLPDLCLDHALKGQGFGSEYEQPFALELAFTDAHKKHASSHPAVREVECLRVLFPAVLQPIEDGDLIAGRIIYPLVAFSPEPQGLGYNCSYGNIRKVLADGGLAESVRSQVETMLEYWRGRTTAELVRQAFPAALAEALPTDAWTTESGVGFPLYRMAGTVLDYAKLVRLGLPGLRAEARSRLEAANGMSVGNEVQPFCRGLLAVYDLLEHSLGHYAKQADALARDCGEAPRVAQLQQIAASCRALSTRAPASLHEAAQLVWLYALHAGTWNYGRMDEYLGEFLERDLAQGVLTETGAVELLCSWWRLMKAYDNQYNNRVFLGGRGRTNESASDRFALLAMEATRLVRLNQPQLSLRFYKGQNTALMEKALTVLGEGCTFPILYNDDVNIPAVAKAFAVAESEAVHYTPYGCGEYVLANRSVGTPNGVINLAKALELALHNGLDPVTGRQAGPLTGAATSHTTFQALWNAYAQQVEYSVRALADAEKLCYAITGHEAPFLFLSALYDDCLTRGKPIFAGGVRYLGGTLETYGNTNAADALHAINELVFKQGKCALTALIAACDSDFLGAQHEPIQRDLLRTTKYGNDEDTVDAMAIRVHEHVCNLTREQAVRVGLDSYLVVIINNWANVIFGQTTQASADGRKAGTPLANANNPAPGMDRTGTTAFLNSLVKLDPSLHAGAVQNMKFSRELFNRHRPKLEAMLDGYWAAGGSQAMLTVVSPADLRKAMHEPEKWGHLMVRVGGFSARFIDLPKGAQEEVLKRTLNE